MTGKSKTELKCRFSLVPERNGTGLDAELHGDLATILDYCGGSSEKEELPGSREPGSQLSVVAGARNQRYLHLDFAPIG